MPSRMSIQERINHAEDRDEATLNLSFRIKDLNLLMKKLDISPMDGTDDLSAAIVRKILIS